MKGVYLVAILYVATLGVVAPNESPVADIPTQCPPNLPRNETVFIPHESDCTKFYNCYMGKKGEPLECPVMDKSGNRLHFNPKLQVCDWPWSAGCELSSSTLTTPSSSFPTSVTTPSSSSIPTTPSSSFPTATTPTPSSPTPTTPSPTSPTPTTPTPSSSTPTTPTPSSPTPTTPSPTSPTPTTPTPSSPTPTTPTPSSSTPTTPTPSSPSSTTPTPSSLTPTTPTTSSPTPTTPSPSSPTTPSSASCISDGRIHMIPHETRCDYYYTCFNGTVNLTPQKCDRNLLFNPKLLVCDYPENVHCTNEYPNTDIMPSTIHSLITTWASSNPSLTSLQFSPTTTKPVDPSAWICEANGKRYKVPHEAMCDYFYWCINGIKGTEPIQCANDKLFNPVVGQCDYPEEVDCEGRSTPSRSTSTPTKTPPTPTPTKTPPTPTPTETPPTPTPTKTPPTPTPTETPPTPTPTKTPPTPTPTETPPTSTPTDIPTTTRDPNKPRKDCPPKGSTDKARIAHPCLCNQYYECIDGEKVLETCPFGKHFDYKKEICDWVAVVKCIRPIPDFDFLTFDISIDDYNTTCAPEGRAFQHETDCSSYYLCSNGEKILKQCVEGLHFNVSIQTCDYPQKNCALDRALPIIDPNFCPPSDSIEKVFLPHECECAQYYECVNGKQVLRSCPNGLHFNRFWQICNNPTEAKCAAETILTTPRTVSTTTSTIDKPRIACPPKGSTENARFSHPCLCDQYFECVEGDKVLQICPSGMYFDKTKLVCDWATKVKCIQLLPSHNIPTSDDDTKCYPDGRAFQHEASCTEYYYCSKGNKILKHCLEGLHFNVTAQICDYPKKKCDLTPPPTASLDICPPSGSVEKVLLPHECACTQYYECIDGKQILRDCSDGLHYDYVRSVCNEPYEAQCASFVPTVPTGWSSSTSDSDTCYENNEMPHEYDCKSYYECNNGKKILKTCPRNLHFNPKLRVCDFPENVACDAGSVNLPSVPTSTKCGAITGTTKIPHETDCNLYYVCENGVSTLKKCHSPELVFNPTLKVCDFPENYVCNVMHAKNDIEEIDRTIIIRDSSTCIGTCPEKDPKDAVFLPNDDCKKFCMCSGGMTWVLSCPDPLYFDSVHNICTWKKDAVCGVRLYNQGSTSTIDRTIDDDNSVKPLTNENNERRVYDNLDPSTCIGTCPEEDPEFAVFLPNDDCKKFCLCSGGVAWVQSCPEPLYFDSIQKVCKKKKDAVCGKRSYNQGSVSMIDRTIDNDNLVKPLTNENNGRGAYDNLDPSTCIGTCPEEDPIYAVFLPNDDCKKFCLCSGGVAWVQSCPEPLYFDSIQKVCKKKKDAVCGKRSYNQGSVSTIDRTIDNENSVKPLTNENNGRGVYDNLDPSTCIGTCPEEDPEFAVFLPNDDCKKFCLCSGGVAWVQSCPEPLYFDSIETVCKKKKDAVCGKRSYNQDSVSMIDRTIDNENSVKPLTNENNGRGVYDNFDPSTCIGTCPEEDPEFAVFLPNDDCKKFCLCSGGVAWVQSCPEPLYFDSIETVCKKKKDAVCGKRSYNQGSVSMIDRTIDNENSVKPLTNENNGREVYDNLDPSTCIGTCPEEDPEFAVFLPNDDCKKFCLCSGGVAWVQSCPEPLYFDSIETVCKKKKDAVCGKRSYTQGSVSTIDRTMNNENLVKPLTNENNGRGAYDNLDPSTCIGTCPEEDPIYAVFLPNDDCKNFCLCSGGVAWVQSCPEPLYFDSIQKVCKKKKDAVCGKRSYNHGSVSTIDRTIDNENLVKPPTNENNGRGAYDNLDPSTCIGTCPEEDPIYAVFLPNDDCKKFCLCSGGVAWVQSCPEPLYFDSIQKVCKKKKDAVCGKRSYNHGSVSTIDRTIDNENLVKPPTNENNGRGAYDNLDPSTCIGTCPEEDPEFAVFLPNDDCKKFCLCSGGVAWVQSCPEPLYFDSIQKVCKKKKDAVCGKRSYTQGSVSTIDRTIDNENLVKPLTNENNGRGAYDNLDPSTCIGTCPEEDPIYAVFLPNDDCKKFCLCSGGVAWVQSCPEPLYFDSIQKVCKKKKDAVCGKRSYTQGSVSTIDRTIDNENLVKPLTNENNGRGAYDNLDPSTCIGTCPEEDPIYAVSLPNDDCKKFCLCSGGVAWVQSCPEPLYFDSIQKVCKKKKDAVCGKRSYNQGSVSTIDRTIDNENLVKPLTNENNGRGAYDNLDPSTCIGACPEEDPIYAVFLPNDDCKKFCLCSGGVAWVQSCPEPLYFDSIQKVCKKKKDAVCGVRLFNEHRV